MKLLQPYKNEYISLSSSESMKLITLLEQVLSEVYRKNFGSVIADVRVTSLQPGSVIVNHVVVMQSKVIPATIIAGFLNSVIQYGDSLNALNIGIDPVIGEGQ